MSINRVIISGNLTRDPELRSTAGGMAVLQIGMAVNDRRKDPQTGEWADFPNFVDCVMFGSRAESLAPYLSKGTKIMVDGKLRWSSWERDGQKRSKLEVIIDDLDFGGARQDGGGSSYGGGGGGRSYSAPAAPDVPAPGAYEEDIPF